MVIDCERFVQLSKELEDQQILDELQKHHVKYCLDVSDTLLYDVFASYQISGYMVNNIEMFYSGNISINDLHIIVTSTGVTLRWFSCIFQCRNRPFEEHLNHIGELSALLPYRGMFLPYRKQSDL